MNNYQVEANLDLVGNMINPIIVSLENMGVTHANINQVNLILEELFVNIAKYAYSTNKGFVDISYDINKDTMLLKVTIKDKGKEFNPLLKEEPDIEAKAEDRPIGGLGIYLVKRLTDDITYNRINDENVLTFTKKIVLNNN